MISATSWIRKGAAASLPERFEMTEEQYNDIMRRAKFEIDDAKEAIKKVSHHQKGGAPKKDEKNMEEVEDDLAKFNLDAYSEGESELSEQDLLQNISNIDEVALGDDPYLPDQEVEEEEEDLEDLKIRESDTLLLACRTEDEVSYLEVYVYETEEDNLYVHHDLMLPAFPLCAEWIGSPLASGQANFGNFAAIGTMEPEIEIWNLDILEVPYPSIVLGQRTIKEEKRKKKKSKDSECHTDAVMSLSWNKLHMNLLLSGSADATVKLWDLAQSKVLRSLEHHSDKVQTLQWNPKNSSIMASASYDKKLISFDCRMPNEVTSWNLEEDPECLRWNPHSPETITISDESGRILHFDTRKGSNSEPLFTLAAHPKSVTCLDWNPSLPDCLLTVSADKTVKLWNTKNNNVTCVASRELGLGKVFTGSFCVDAPNLICVAGSKGMLSVVNVLNDPAVVEGFKSNLNQSS